MNRYHNGKIYKLVNSENDKIYIGSTAMPLTKRLSSHKATARHKPEQRVYKELNTVGWDNVRIIQIEEFKCETKNELISREQHFIDLLKPELNKKSAISRCIHDRERYTCTTCSGPGICIHNKQRNHCIPCGGSAICIHNKQRNHCIPCGGASLCIHNKQRRHCKVCDPITCDSCGITTSKGDFNRHLKSNKHLLRITI